MSHFKIPILILLIGNDILALPIDISIIEILPDDNVNSKNDDDNIVISPTPYDKFSNFIDRYFVHRMSIMDEKLEHPSNIDTESPTPESIEALSKFSFTTSSGDSIAPTEIYIDAKFKFIKIMNNIKLILILVAFIMLSSLYYFYIMIKNGWDTSITIVKKIIGLQICYLSMVAIFCIF